MRKDNLLILLILFVLQACTINLFDQKALQRSPSSFSGELTPAIYENLSDTRKAEIDTFKFNLAKFFIEATNKSDNEKIEVFHRAKRYFEVVGPDLYSNIKYEITRSPNPEYKEIVAPPTWTLKEEVNYLSKSIEGRESQITPAQKELMYQAVDFALDQSDVQLVQNSPFDEQVTKEVMSMISTYRGSKDEDLAALVAINKLEDKVQIYSERIRHLGSELQETGKLKFKNKDKQKFVVSF